MDGQNGSYERSNSPDRSSSILKLSPGSSITYPIWERGIAVIGREPDLLVHNGPRTNIEVDEQTPLLRRVHAVIREPMTGSDQLVPCLEILPSEDNPAPGSLLYPVFSDIGIDGEKTGRRATLVDVPLNTYMPAIELPRVSILRLPVDQFKSKKDGLAVDYENLAISREADSYRMFRFRGDLRNMPDDVKRLLHAQAGANTGYLQVVLRKPKDAEAFAAFKQGGRVYVSGMDFNPSKWPLQNYENRQDDSLTQERIEIGNYRFTT